MWNASEMENWRICRTLGTTRTTRIHSVLVVAVVLPSGTHSFILSLGWKAKAETLCDRHLRLRVAIFSDFVARGTLHSLFGDQDVFRNDPSLSEAIRHDLLNVFRLT